MRKIILLLFALAILMTLYSQETSTDDCKSFKDIFKFLLSRKATDTSVTFPLYNRRQKSTFGTAPLGTFTHSFYNSRITFVKQQNAEFAENDGLWNYTASIGSYSSLDGVNLAGSKLSKNILKCVALKDWTISNDKEFYLTMSYSQRDIHVSIFKAKDKSGIYHLRLYMRVYK